MSLGEIQCLDQAIDFSAQQYVDTADDYAGYLRDEYADNRAKTDDNWERHYDRVRTEINGHIDDLLETGINRRDLNVAIIGPGLTPVGAELGSTACMKTLPKVNSIVVGDFSPTVVDKAIAQMKGKIKGARTFLPMLIDITDGLSTAYRRLIQTEIVPVQTENELFEASERLADLGCDELRSRLIELLTEVDYEQWENEEAAHSTFPEIFRLGGLNKSRNRYRLTVNNGAKELPLNSVILPCVVAGTGAAAEHDVWAAKEAVTSEEGRGANSSTSANLRKRDQMTRNLYKLITRYNTLVASKAIGDILRDNPQAHLLAVTDISTLFYSGDVGRVTRLDVEKLSEMLQAQNILLKREGSWEWHDQPDEHYHQVEALHCTMME